MQNTEEEHRAFCEDSTQQSPLCYNQLFQKLKKDTIYFNFDFFYLSTPFMRCRYLFETKTPPPHAAFKMNNNIIGTC